MKPVVDCQTKENVPAPIAIVGIAVRLPGGVRSTEEFWQMLSGGQDGRCVVPESRYNEAGFYSESGAHSIGTRYGYFLQDDLEKVDTSFFDKDGLQPGRMDPQQKLLLQVVWDCLENAGQVRWRGMPIGCFVGTFGGDWEEIETKDTQNAHNFHLIGRGKFALANVVSYEFDFKGPSMTLETGCSSSLVALNQACQALEMGDCTSAVVAGSNLIFSPTIGMQGAALSVFSPSGISKSFDASADGYGRGEAVNAVLIKRLGDAIRDGDPIRAVIRSTMVNCDGRSPGITTPSAEAQEKLIFGAYQKASIGDISQTAFVECHGTGTLAGDPIECSAISKIFPKGVYIGSVKPNVGHSEGASGLTSLVKAVLSLEHRQIPPNIHFHLPNPRIPWEENRLRVPTKLTAWPKNRKERISVSNFGIGGTNAHVIVDSSSSLRRTSTAQNTGEDSRYLLLLLSAKSQAALLRRRESILKYMVLHPSRLENLEYTLAARREHLTHRGFLIKPRDVEQSMGDMKSSVVGQMPKLIFTFTGQGAQWPGMGRELMARFSIFRDTIRSLDHILQSLESHPSWSLEDTLVDPDNDRINAPKLSQTLCCALQIALVNLLTERGCHPTSVIGHSSGEIAAAYAAGAITAKCAIAISYYRGLLVESSPLGAMAAVGLNREIVELYLQDDVVLACENSPTSITLSGEPSQLEVVLNRIKSDHPDVLCRQLRVDRAYHSRQFNSSLFRGPGSIVCDTNSNIGFMAPIAKLYTSHICPYMELQKEMIPMYSSLTGDRVSDPYQLNTEYWCRNLTSPVLFYDAAKSIFDEIQASTFFLEVGPHSALAGPLRDIFKECRNTKNEMSYASCLVRGQDQESSLLRSLGDLFLSGIPVNPVASNGCREVLTDLDPYPWECGKTDWRETRLTREWRFRPFGHHELLGSRVLESTQIEPAWRSMLHINDVPWLWDHRIGGSIIFPCAGYIAMIGEAISQITRCDKYCLKDLRINKALVLDDHERMEIVTTLRPVRSTNQQGSGWYEFSIMAFRRGSWINHCTGQGRGEKSSSKSRDIRSFPRKVESKVWYGSLKDRGLEYGPRFSQLQNISAHPVQSSAAASLEIPDPGNMIDPPTIDQCLQLVAVAMCNGLPRKCHSAGLPVYIKEVFAGKTGPTLFLEATAAVTSLGLSSGSGIAQWGSQVAVRIDGVEFVGLDDGQSVDGDLQLCSNATLAPDVDVLPTDHLLSSPEPTIGSLNEQYFPKYQFFDMCLVETARRITSLEPASDHLRKYQRWIISKSAAVLKSSDPVKKSRIQALLRAPRQEWIDILTGIRQEIEATMPLTNCFAELSFAILEQCADIVEGKCSPLAILMENERLTRLYNTGSQRNYEYFLKVLGHSRPNLEIIEIGAGTGATTARVLRALHPPGNNRQYSRTGYQSPLAEQGIETESYDLVVASNVLHATPSIQESLLNVKSLLKPGGRILIEEICSDALPIDYIMGVLPGWWMGESDNRVDSPYISADRWHEELQRAGFVDIHEKADEAEIYMTSIIASVASPRRLDHGTVNLLCHSKKHPWIIELAQKLKDAGFSVAWCTISNPPPPNEDVIFLLDIEEPFLYQMTQHSYEQVREYISSCTSTRVLWATWNSQKLCQNPRYGLTLGFARTMRVEYEMVFTTVELDNFDQKSQATLVEIYRKFQRDRFETNDTVDYEYAIKDGVAHIPRYRWGSLSQNLLEDAARDEPRTLTIEQPGILESLTWVEKAMPPLGEQDVEIDIKFVGMNFRDLMVGLGMLQAKDELGLEGSGIIRRVGSGVTHLHTGDKVIFLATPAFSTRIMVSASLVVAIPTGISLEEAATVGCAYTTAVHCLLNVGRLEKGQWKIFATVGNQDKAQYLTDAFGIRKEHIFDSRSVSFSASLLRRTQGRGVDLVLNSLAGDLLLASWDCVAEGGIMVEIGKRDLVGHAMLPMDRFLANRSFVGVDILTLANSRPKIVQDCLNQVTCLLTRKSITPIQPIRTFAAGQIAEAFKHMQEGKHMGKIVVQIPGGGSTHPNIQSQN
ncbi:hypothetical protein N7450_006452 [Penicillium hetheringtonii]|uniref:Carrier domain-containing protein n=1 Tax=Penicillium hetheringtonii TaxID=911720 RepID=A0AAD6DHY2_9EURO|nr:hypothetical protein N7450_006452 [Penicillium hetheringtonii]